MTEEEYRASVQKSKEDAHDETMWGKPARDIVTGIGNNGGIRPVRAIWELVQNARDVVGANKRAKIQQCCSGGSVWYGILNYTPVWIVLQVDGSVADI